MGKVILDISMSLDGFIAGLNDEIEPPHDWVFSGETASSYNEFFKPLGNSRLFDHRGTEHIELERMRVIESPGVTHLRFRVVK